MNSISFRWFMLLGCALAWPAFDFVSAAEPEWKVGVASIDVTPKQPVVMSGYASRTKPFDKVATELYVKALVIEDQEAHRGVLVSSDLIGFSATVAEPICERLQKSLGLSRS